MKCPCEEADTLRSIKRILLKEIIWFKENQHDEDLIYDESFRQFTSLSRRQCAELLKFISKDP
jgi:hypothetical protein